MDAIVLLVVASAARFLLGSLLVVSGFSKLRQFHAFYVGLLDYRVPPFVALPLARTLPLIELLVGVALLGDVEPGLAGMSAAILFASFLIPVVVNLAAGRRVACLCFGPHGEEQLGFGTVARLIVLASTGVLVSEFAPRAAALDVVTMLLSLLLALSIIQLYAFAGATPRLIGAFRAKPVRGLTHHGGRIALRGASAIQFRN
jgi:hypothetical protein